MKENKILFKVKKDPNYIISLDITNNIVITMSLSPTKYEAHLCLWKADDTTAKWFR